MQLLRLAEVEESARDRVFRYSRIHAILIAIAGVTADAALLCRAATSRWVAGYYIAAVVTFFLLLTKRFISARFRSSNWLVRMNDAGLYIKFRSYLNYHLPTEDRTVVFVPYQEISSARLVRERARVPDLQGHTATQMFRYIELELAGDTKPLERALQSEISERAPAEKRWYGSDSTLYEDYPVRMTSPPYLQLRWQVVPGTHKFLQALRPNTSIAEPVSIKQDFANLGAMSREEQQQRLRELAQRGEMIAATYLARKLYGCTYQEATAMVDSLKSGAAV